MDEKADATPPVPPEEEANSVSDEHDEDTLLSAGNDNEHGSPTDAAELSPAMDTDPLAPTDTTQTETEAAVATNDSLASETTGTPLDSFISSDALSVADALTSVDDLRSAEELTSENVQASASSVLDKISSVDTSASSVVCQLEEELKRLHEGDPLEDIKPEENIATDEKSVVEKQEEKPEAEVKPQIVLKTTSVIARPMIKPVVELTKVRANPDEMLSAESIAKDPLLIRRAQADLKTTDVLVCGKCHEVFHFAEEFQKHKTGSFCTGKSHLLPICESESKPQVWGFTLWKHKYNKLLKDGDSPIPSSWAIYQKWCKLPQPDKNAWITAGQTIQFCTKIGTSKVTEVRAKVVPKPIERDPLALDGFAESNKENSAIGNGDAKPSEVVRRSIIRPVRLNNDVTILPKKETDSNKALRTVKSTETREYAVERIVAKRFNSKRKCFEYQIKWEHFPSEENTWEPISNLNHCKQMVAEFEEQLKMLKAEKAKQQASVLMARGIHTKPFKPSPIVSTASSSFGNDSTPGRPTRTSKQKALNQVKAWCGNISEDEGSGKRPREDDDSDESFEKRIKYEDFSDDSDVDVKPKLEVKPKITYRRIQPKPTPPVQKLMRNGLDAMTPLPQNVLIPDANGVVRINQKQLPSLSTGVYIMSKTAGIIKLDSTTSKVATSGGQTIVKVAPKVGQTQIKIVKKDGQTTTTKQIIQMAPNKSVSSTPTTLAKSTFKPVITKVKRVGEGTPRVTVLPKSKPVATKIIVKPKDETKQQQPVQQAPPPPTPPQQKEEESDDGLEELPFPDEIKVPEPESPPSEFVLDPITGKIAGREYPEPVPEPEHTKMETEDNSLENIVKLAAADITEDDLKNESDEAPVQTQVVARPPVQPPKKVETFKRIISSPIKPQRAAPVRVTMTPTLVRREPSVLNRSVGGTPTNILRKSLTTAPHTAPKVQQRILNPSIGSRTHMGSIVRMPPRPSLIRTRPVAPKPKYNIASPSGIIKTQHEVSPRNVYTKSTISSPGITRKIGNTTIRSTTVSAASSRPVTRIVQTSTIHKVAPRKEPIMIRQVIEKPQLTITPRPKPKTVISMPSLISESVTPVTAKQFIQSAPKPKPKTVISMPSLIGDDEPEPSPPAPAPQAPAPPVVEEITKPSTSPAPSLPIVTASPVIDTPTSTLTLTQAPTVETPTEQTEPSPEPSTSSGVATDISSFTLADNENPIFITGDDGTVYQVAGQNEQGQTILLTQGSDGQQQCLLVTNEVAETMETAEEPQADISMPEIPENVTEPLSVKTDADTSDQVVAQVVRAEPPSPGGTHKVVVMLPDGNLMVTQVSPEEYASLELE